VRHLSLLVVAVLLALPAHAGAGAGATRATRAPKHQMVEIGRAKRAAVIGPRIKNLASIRGIQGPKSTIYAGLRDYRSVRNRVRELRTRLADVMTVKPLVKSGPFVLDRIDLRSKSPGTRPKVLVVGGVHSGSEPVGVEAALRFAEGFAADPTLLEHFDITVVPLVNPSGLTRAPATVSASGTPGRYTTEGVDINRSFVFQRMFEWVRSKWTPESKAMARMMRTEKFDVILDLHGAGTSRTGFFAIRSGDDRGMAARFMAEVGQQAPILDAQGAGSTYELDAPGVVTSTNAGTLKQMGARLGARFSYTFETPARFTPAQQVRGALAMVHSALRNIRDHGGL